jgi:hypothetical protein
VTQEQRIYIDASDFQEIELRCKSCGATMNWNLEQVNFANNCITCNAEWFKMGASTDSRKVVLLDLIDALRKLRGSFSEVGCSVAFRLKNERS